MTSVSTTNPRRAGDADLGHEPPSPAPASPPPPSRVHSTAAGAPIGLCLPCGYALHGLPTPRCPECGREFDPLDPKTMNMGRELSELAKFVLGPVRWPVSWMSWGA